jgi:hypothetical protein
MISRWPGQAVAVGDDQAAGDFAAAFDQAIETRAQPIVRRHVDGFLGGRDDVVDLVIAIDE